MRYEFWEDIKVRMVIPLIIQNLFFELYIFEPTQFLGV